MKLLYGTGNPAKLESMRRRLAGMDFEIMGLKDMEKEAPQVPEDGGTPLENARQKALAYHTFYGIPVFSCDSGLYFEGLPQALQPGVHVRTVNGRCLTDQEMLEYYSYLARKYGNLKARYQNAICLVADMEHIYESMDESLASDFFLITAVPHSRIQHKGFPLDSLSVDMKTGKYFYDLEEGKIDQVAVEDGFLDFFKNYRNLLSTEKGDSQK
jgi:8-oxo-dGTP diphosphatase